MAVNTPADVLADFQVSAPRKGQYTPREGVQFVTVPKIGPHATVTVGDRSRDGVPSLYVENGDVQIGVPMSAVGRALEAQLISPAQVVALCGADVLKKVIDKQS